MNNCEECGGRTGAHTSECLGRLVTVREVEEIVDRRLEQASALRVYGNASYKMIGEMVGQALLQESIVVIDGTKLRRIGGHKPRWLP